MCPAISKTNVYGEELGGVMVMWGDDPHLNYMCMGECLEGKGLF